jgi:hypothetical protein
MSTLLSRVFVNNSFRPLTFVAVAVMVLSGCASKSVTVAENTNASSGTQVVKPTGLDIELPSSKEILFPKKWFRN